MLRKHGIVVVQLLFGLASFGTAAPGSEARVRDLQCGCGCPGRTAPTGQSTYIYNTSGKTR